MHFIFQIKEEKLQVSAAMQACPVGAIRTHSSDETILQNKDIFPYEVIVFFLFVSFSFHDDEISSYCKINATHIPGVMHLGYHAEVIQNKTFNYNHIYTPL